MSPHAAKVLKPAPDLPTANTHCHAPAPAYTPPTVPCQPPHIWSLRRPPTQATRAPLQAHPRLLPHIADRPRSLQSSAHPNRTSVASLPTSKPIKPCDRRVEPSPPRALGLHPQWQHDLWERTRVCGEGFWRVFGGFLEGCWRVVGGFVGAGRVFGRHFLQRGWSNMLTRRLFRTGEVRGRVLKPFKRGFKRVLKGF